LIKKETGCIPLQRKNTKTKNKKYKILYYGKNATVSGSLCPLTTVLTLYLAGSVAKDLQVSPVELETAHICVVGAMQRWIGPLAQARRNVHHSSETRCVGR